jgi:hypothetical protein
MFKRLILPLIVIAALVAAYFAVVLNWSYSNGERAGWLQKLSYKGWLCKTWEGEMALASTPGAPVEKFFFTVTDDAVAAQLNSRMGQRVTMHYDQRMGLPTSCFGETRYYVNKVGALEGITLSPGVVVQTGPNASGAAAPVPSVPVAP